MVTTHKYLGDTLTITPTNYRHRFPDIKKFEIRDGVTYAIPYSMFDAPLEIGMIPADFKLVRKDKYELIYKTKTPRPIKKRSW